MLPAHREQLPESQPREDETRHHRLPLAEITGILALVRNCLPEYQWVIDAGWNIADCVSRSSDLEGMEVGTVGQGGSAPRCCGSSPSRWGCTTPIVTASPRSWSESSASPIGHSSTKDWPRRNPVRL